MTEYLPLFLKALTFKYEGENRADDLHVSDLLCPRQSVFSRVIPRPPTMKDVEFFAMGKALHIILQGLLEHPEMKDRFIIENEVWFDEDLEAHIDIFDKLTGTPVELKTSRTMKEVKANNPEFHYLEQLHRYMAMTNSRAGNIIVFFVNHFMFKKISLDESGGMKEWPISFTEDQLLEAKVKLLKDKDAFKRALLAKNPGMAHHVMFDDKLNWKCDGCKWLVECQELNKIAKIKKDKELAKIQDEAQEWAESEDAMKDVGKTANT